MEPAFTVVIPAFDEESSLPGFLSEVLAEGGNTGLPFEVIVVDDGSRDGTRAAAGRAAAADPRVRVLAHERNLGLGAALQTGHRAGRGDIHLWLPADGQIPASAIPAFLQAARSADVVASTYSRRPDSWLRRLVSWAWRRVLMERLLGLADRIEGPVVYRRAVREAVLPTSTTGLFCKELLLGARRKGFRVASIEIPCEPRRRGVSKVANARTAWRTLRETMALKRRNRREAS